MLESNRRKEVSHIFSDTGCFKILCYAYVRSVHGMLPIFKDWSIHTTYIYKTFKL